jgi:hypothetical protein
MNRTQKTILFILAFLGIVYFIIFCFPNSSGSKNIQMVAVFEPDEAVPLPYVFDMIKPAETVKQALINFLFYDYYFYGYPHFALSGLLLIPLKLLGQLGNIPLVMLILRQFVSVLPLEIALLLLVYLQTEFRSYKAIVLFILLLSIPAVVRNNLWWHPDALAILFAMLAIFFLYRDALRLGKNFFLGGAMCGFSAGAKGIGFFFFLSIAIYLLVVLVEKKASLKKTILSAAGFLLAMGAAYLAANPILIYESIRRRYFQVMSEQSSLLYSGYEVVYAKGLAAAWPQVKEYYGNAFFLLSAFGACCWGILHKKKQLLFGIILTWMIPISILVFFLTHFKFQYWLPVALPLLSSLALVLPDHLTFVSFGAQAGWKSRLSGLLQIVLLLILVVQLVSNIVADYHTIQNNYNEERTDPSILFYDQARKTLALLPQGSYFIYHDVRMYVPQTVGWATEGIFEMLNYDYIQQRNFDVLLLVQQRLYDYLNPDVTGIDQKKLENSRLFYKDANEGKVEGYRLIFRNKFGLIYLKTSLYEKYFPSGKQPSATP